jgi:hypothetical protein
VKPVLIQEFFKRSSINLKHLRFNFLLRYQKKKQTNFFFIRSSDDRFLFLIFFIFR